MKPFSFVDATPPFGMLRVLKTGFFFFSPLESSLFFEKLSALSSFTPSRHLYQLIRWDTPVPSPL